MAWFFSGRRSLHPAPLLLEKDGRLPGSDSHCLMCKGQVLEGVRRGTLHNLVLTSFALTLFQFSGHAKL